MDREFQVAYKQLNGKQKEAVDTIDGPVLVIAGPGTGKTQLLSLRVANIIRQTDTAPGNILCLTFTDNAARNMRERLETIIGRSAYHVGIYTFHSFGSEIINRFPDYFTDRQLIQQIDELGRYELLKSIFEGLPHSNPLSAKVGDDFVHLKDTLDAIRWLKQNAIMPYELHELINANQVFMEAVVDDVAEVFAATPSAKNLPLYEKFLETIKQHVAGLDYFGFPEYAHECAAELEKAIAGTNPAGRYAPLITAWRNQWCHKDAHGNHVFKDAGRNMRKMHALANVYQNLLDEMTRQGLYDFDDMIIEVVHALEKHPELRYTFQERYQYVLVDEFQDTNKAQLRILTSLGDNPIHENRPNIMAVGDDDQAIYAFQGAEVSNMVTFAKQYRDPKLITLQDNYRSTPTILEAGFCVAEQITDRLESVLPGIHKQLTAQATHDSDTLTHSVFASELAQYDWIAEEIQAYVKDGTQPEAIAVIAPRHKYLERLMPYIGNRQVPVAYERRENVLDSPLIIQLATMAELVTAITENRHNDIDSLISEVLGYDFWQLSGEDILKISLECYNQNLHWLPVLLKQPDKKLREIAVWFMDLARHSSYEPLEYMLDKLIGGVADGVDSEYGDLVLPVKYESNFISPLRSFYFNSARYDQATDLYLELLGQLSSLRQRLRQWKPNQALYIKDFVEFAKLHRSANLKIIDSSPHTQTTNAVQVMTAYKAKGLEFEVVFVINAQDEVWGPTTRSRSSSITLPRNLPIAPAGESDNDKLRLFFVALTRAKHTLHVTGYTHTLDNKLSASLSFIAGDSPEEYIHPAFKPVTIDKPATPAAIEILSTDWAYRFRQIFADKPSLFEPILANYKLSVTHLNNFVDVKDGGPDYFFLHNLLRFPAAPTPSAAYGDAVHKTLQWAHAELRKNSQMPNMKSIQAYFADLLARKHLRAADHKKLDRRGHEALGLYFKERGKLLSPDDLVERGFNNEGVVISAARLSGKIDKLRFTEDGSAQVIDFKTGKPAHSWQGRDEYEKLKLHKYRQQLLFYKLLVENSASYHKKLSVTTGALEFIEPDDQGKLVDNLEITFQPEEIDDFTKLIGAVWRHIVELNFPDISQYPKNVRGLTQFEQDLMNKRI